MLVKLFTRNHALVILVTSDYAFAGRLRIPS